MSCPDVQVLRTLAEGALPQEETAAAREHLRSCERCQASHASGAESGASRPQDDAATTAIGPPQALAPSSSQATPRVLEPGERLGRYVISKRLAAGGMGEVYQAYDPQLDRPVALKLLLPELLERGLGAQEGRARLLREAQAMARLSHPNVVAVHDVGLAGDQVFIAMEYLDGTTLKQWRQEQPRSWREVVEAFMQAGRGLAAAHAAGLVHRDFKPQNVLIARDGRVCVLDFGLARPATQTPTVPPSPALTEETTPQGSGSSAGSSALDTPLTQVGKVMGTTGYMSPEQLLGEAADARSDQFSFCVALYESLHGERPFPGRNLETYRQAVLLGTPPALQRSSPVPAWVQALVLKGLSRKPQERFASMDELLQALARDPLAARRRRLQGAAAAALLLGLSTWLVLRPSPPPPCQGAEGRWEGTWEPARQQAMHQAFLATRKPYAEAAWRGAQQVLERYRQQWVAMHEDACLATRVRGEQSEEVLTLRMRCLDRRLKEVRALGDVWLQADAKVVERALQASEGLTPLSRCADLESLSKQELLPADPALRARVEELQGQLAEARALLESGRYKPGRDRAAALAEAATATGHAPLEAEVWLLLAMAQYQSGNLAEAEQSAHHAARAALTSSQPYRAAQAWLWLLVPLGHSVRSPEEIERWAGYARAAIVSAGQPTELLASFERKLAFANSKQGRPLQALEHARRALALMESHYGPEHTETALALYEVARASSTSSPPEETLEAERRALAVAEKAMGPGHPFLARILNLMALTLLSAGRPQEALAMQERVVALREQLLEPDNPELGLSLNKLALYHLELGHAAEADRILERAQPLIERKLGRQSWDYAENLLLRGMSHHRQGQHAQALALGREALATVEKALGPNHPDLTLYLTFIGETELALGRVSQALAPLERALALGQHTPWAPEEAGRARFALARALWDKSQGNSRSRARALLAQARKDFEQAREAGKEELAAWEAWVSARQVSFLP